jgi:hypothetical protein
MNGTCNSIRCQSLASHYSSNIWSENEMCIASDVLDLDLRLKIKVDRGAVLSTTNLYPTHPLPLTLGA